MSALPKRYFTPEEYLELEVKADYKSQYVAGEIYAMAGVEPWHIEILGNITKALGVAFGDRPCKSYSTDMRVRSKHPANPQVIFEVLSPSTEAFDCGDKFARYRKLASLTDYVLVTSEFMRVEHFVRQASGGWTMTEYSQSSDRLPLRTLECELSLADLYRRVDFPSDLLGE